MTEFCTVPGCGRALSARNTSRVCHGHSHCRPYCRCAFCTGRRKNDGGRQPNKKPEPVVMKPYREPSMPKLPWEDQT